MGPWTIVGGILTVLSFLADNQTVMGWVGTTPYPWGAIIGTVLGTSVVVKRWWMPSAPGAGQVLNLMTDPKFLELLSKAAAAKPEASPVIVVQNKDGSEFKISSERPNGQPGQIG